ncbi:MAG: hypothetical protein E6K69_10975, partial [Nitrospirae bacterium]
MTLKPALSHTRLTGWLLDVYPDRTGMAVWFLDDEGRRFRLLDPYHPAFYLTGPQSALTAALRTLRHSHVTIRLVERRELGMRDVMPVAEVAVCEPLAFTALVRSLIRRFELLQFYQADVSLPQLYFYDRQLFPLARCEVEVTNEGMIQSIYAMDSPWDTYYEVPPLSILELSLEGASADPN